MATFTSWAAELTRFKNALATMTTSQMVQAGYTDGNGQTVTFKRYQDLIEYGDYLERQAGLEANSQTGGRRSTMVPLGYGGL